MLLFLFLLCFNFDVVLIAGKVRTHLPFLLFGHLPFSVFGCLPFLDEAATVKENGFLLCQI